ncbi:MAG: bacillithiol biosynthesis cysteine-adding enzyme BshC [Bacteroidota bacterium]|nr:bacillithiol biosynthesis cysteine-adding enzyme BshC [Bacteroidota bacterium]
MTLKSEFIDYLQTDCFSKIVTDYLSPNNLLNNFYQHPFNLKGIQSSIEERKKYNTNRKLLVEQLTLQYAPVKAYGKVKYNINALLDSDTFTVCTAHQPNIFTGHLYFIYKIIHAIKLADILNNNLPQHKFVPVFYMGSEDADIDELGHIFINSEKYEWHTRQTGAVGRMIVDDALINILNKVQGQLSVEPFGKEIIQLVQDCYKKGTTIQDASFELINELFGNYGLIVLLPDNKELKRVMLPIFEDDIFNNSAFEIVNKTSEKLSQQYKIQVHPREINLFYLKDAVRKRIIKTKSKFKIYDSELVFTEDEIKNEIKNYPERFSPNVILRGIYQETILPNIAFIGGGGELAYWLELKDLFLHYKIPFPVLALRNSFVIINEKINLLIQKLSLTSADIFKTESELTSEIVKKNSSHKLSLEKEKQQIELLYQSIKNPVTKIDTTLTRHVDSLLAKALKQLENLEKKLLKAEKKRFESQQRQIQQIKTYLFPNNELQERVENFMPFYAKWGDKFISILYENSLSFEQQFCIIEETE